MAKSNKQQQADDSILQEAKDRFCEAYDRDRRNLELEIDDLEFLDDQWDPEARKQRKNRPCMTVDKTSEYIELVVGEQRQMRPGMKAVPVDSRSDPETADIIGGHFRYIENRSNARHAYAQGGFRQVAAGMGHWRVTTDYADESTFNQEILIETVDGAVVWDPDAIAPTREDAMYCFVYRDMNRKKFKEDYPDNAADGDFESIGDTDGTYASWSQWSTDDFIRLAEYWCKKPIKRKLLVMPDGGVDDLTDDPKAEEKLANLAQQTAQAEAIALQAAELGIPAPEAEELPRVEERDGFRVMRYLLTANSIIETTEWKGRYIPIVPCIGKEIRIGRKVIRKGMVRALKDPARRYNFFVSAQTEVVALQPKAPWVGTAKNFSVDPAWGMANVENLPFLTYEPDSSNGGMPPTRMQPPVSSQGISEGLAIAAQDMDAVSGKYPATRGERSNETSGIAIQRRKSQGDTTSFVYINNFTLAIAYTGRLILDLMPHVYDTERMLSIMSEDGTREQVTVNRSVVDPNQETLDAIEHDITTGAYDIVMSAGPAYETRREESRDGMIQFAQAMPDTAAVFPDLIAKAQDWPGSDEISERLKRTIPPQILGEEQQEPPQPTQEAVDEQVKAQAKQIETEAKNAETQINIQEAQQKAQIEQQSKLFELEAQRRKLLLGVEEKRAAVQASIAKTGGATPEQEAALQGFDEIEEANRMPIADLNTQLQ